MGLHKDPEEKRNNPLERALGAQIRGAIWKTQLNWAITIAGAVVVSHYTDMGSSQERNGAIDDKNHRGKQLLVCFESHFSFFDATCNG